MGAEKQKTILLVDDEAIIAMAEKMSLEKYGYGILIANSGEEAITTVEQTPGIDLILMDINLGKGIDGTEAAAIILKDHDLPVVFLSSHTEPEVVEKTEKITSYGYVVKNSSITVLDASIKMAFKLFAAKIREKEKEKVLQDIIDKNPLSIQIVDKEGFTLKTNSAHTLLFGAPPPADFSIFNDLQLKRQGFGGLIERIKNGEVVHFPVTRYNAHDSVPEVPDVPVWIQTLVFPIHDSSGKPENFVFMHENITKSKEAEEALRESKEWFRTIISNTPDHIISHDIDLRYLFVVNPQLGLTEADMLGKTDLDILEKGEAENLIAIKRKVIDTGEPYYLQIPLRNLKGENEYFEGSFIPKLDSAGKPDGLIGYFRNVTQRKLAETQREAMLEALQESEKRWRLSIDNMLEGYALHEAILDKNGRMVDYRFLEFNPTAQKIANTARKDIVGKTALGLYPHIVERGLMDRYADVMASGEPAHINDFYYTGDNLDKALDISCFRIDDRHFACVFRDITAIKKSEAELKKSQILLRSSIESPKDMIILSIDKQYRYLYFNTFHKNVMANAYGKEVKLGMNLLECISNDDDRMKSKINFDRALAGESHTTIEEYGDLDRYFYETRYNPIINDKGEVMGATAFSTDISKRKRAEALLQQERESYLDLVNNQPMGIYRLRVFPREQWQRDAWKSSENSPYSLELVNDRFCEILGINRQVFETNPGFLNDLIYVEDKEEFARKNEEANVKMIPFQWEGRLVIKGKILWVHFQSLPRPGKNGDVLWMGSLYDITEHKREEAQKEAALKALRESEDRYRDLVENSQDLICTHDLEGKVLSVNEAAARLTGYPLKDLLNMNMADLLVPEVRHLFKPYLAEIKARGWARGTMRVQTAGGEHRHWEFYNTLRDKGATTPVVRGLGRDITERERAEVEIKRQLAEKEILLKEVHHRIKNNIASISGLLSLRLHSVANSEAIAVLKDAIGRVDSMRILYDKLLLSEDYKDISVKNYVESLIDTVIALFPDNAKVKIDKRIGDFHLDSRQLFPLGIIVNELITNIMKYAFRDLGSGLIRIALVNLDNQVTLTIRDNGIGLPDGFDINKSTGFGFMLVKMLSQQLGGSFSIKKHAGTWCTVAFTI